MALVNVKAQLADEARFLDPELRTTDWEVRNNKVFGRDALEVVRFIKLEVNKMSPMELWRVLGVVRKYFHLCIDMTERSSFSLRRETCDSVFDKFHDDVANAVRRLRAKDRMRTDYQMKAIDKFADVRAIRELATSEERMVAYLAGVSRSLYSPEATLLDS